MESNLLFVLLPKIKNPNKMRELKRKNINTIE